MQNLLDSLVEKNRFWTQYGSVATYIPELANSNSDSLGIYIIDTNGKEYCSGEYDTKFTIQSISKIASFMCALQDNDINKLYSKISCAPTSDGFNSIVNLEMKNSHKPLNPMINSGAIATVSLVYGKDATEKFERIFNFIKEITNNPNLKINYNIYESEKNTGDRNRALAYFMKSTGIIDCNVDEILDVYFKLCSIEVTCKDIAHMSVVLASDGIAPVSNKQILDKHICKTVKAIMTTCGMYDGSGDFAVNVGIPAKSGVGGGIAGVVPRNMGIGVYGPALDKKGNSIGGVKLLEDLSKSLDLNIF